MSITVLVALARFVEELRQFDLSIGQVHAPFCGQGDKVRVLGEAKEDGDAQWAIGVLLQKLARDLVRSRVFAGQVQGGDQPLRQLFGSCRQRFLVQDLFAGRGGFLELLRQLLRVGDFEHHLGAPSLGVSIGRVHRDGFVGRLTKRLDRVLQAVVAIGGLRRIDDGQCDAGLRFAEPELNLIRQPRLLVEHRLQCLDRFRVHLHLHLAEADAQLRFGTSGDCG